MKRVNIMPNFPSSHYYSKLVDNKIRICMYIPDVPVNAWGFMHQTYGTHRLCMLLCCYASAFGHCNHMQHKIQSLAPIFIRKFKKT